MSSKMLFFLYEMENNESTSQIILTLKSYFIFFLNISDSIPFISYILLPIKASTQMTQELSKYFYSTKAPNHINVFLAILGRQFHKLR